jgi:hypothetical protein
MDISFSDGFESITTRVNFIPTSTLSLATLDEYLTNIFKAYNINISVKMNDLSLLEFRSTYEFSIVDMSYNIKLLTGFYYINAYPVDSESIEEQISDDPVYLESIAFEDLTVIISRESALIPHPTPLDADYQISYTSVEPAIAIVSPYGIVTGISEGDTLIVIEVRQKDTPVTNPADFISNARITVMEGTEGQITSASLPDSVDIWVGDIEMINPVIDPPNII